MVAVLVKSALTLEEFLANPPEHQEWIDGELTETKGMTVKHSDIQAGLIIAWGTYIRTSKQGGKVYAELPCRTNKQGRRPDVSYLTPELVAEYGDASSLPHSPPLVAEIASPADSAEDLFAKASEYLASNCEEVWLIFPENKRVLIILSNQTLAFANTDVISTQKVLTGFSISLDELFA
jgi:Uma2 family endonuclease